MLYDAENLFSDGQKITATAVSDNVVAVPVNVGDGEPLYLSFMPVEPFAGLTSLEVQLQTSDKADADFVTVQSVTLPVEDLQGDKLVNVGSVPPRTKKYLRLNYVVEGTATAGKVMAGLVLARQTNGLV